MRSFYFKHPTCDIVLHISAICDISAVVCPNATGKGHLSMCASALCTRNMNTSMSDNCLGDYSARDICFVFCAVFFCLQCMIWNKMIISSPKSGKHNLDQYTRNFAYCKKIYFLRTE